MRAWQVNGYGEPSEVLQLGTADDPIAGEGQIVVSVKAIGANFVDVLMCRGAYQVRPPLPFTPGLELCGEVLAVGAGVDGFAVGDRVVGSPEVSTGAYADFALMSTRRAFKAPTTLDDAECAAFFVAYQTGYFGLHRRAQLREGETVLVHAAAGGVGSAAVQISKAAGATVIGVVGSREKVAVAQQLGADVVVNRNDEDFVSVVKEVTEGRGADVVYDPVGGESFERSTKCIAFEGRIITLGFTSGNIPKLSLNHPLVKNYSVLGLHWGLYPERDFQLVANVQAKLTEMADNGGLRPLVSARLGFGDVPQGLQEVADGKSVGRVTFEPR